MIAHNPPLPEKAVWEIPVGIFSRGGDKLKGRAMLTLLWLLQRKGRDRLVEFSLQELGDQTGCRDSRTISSALKVLADLGLVGSRVVCGSQQWLQIGDLKRFGRLTETWQVSPGLIGWCESGHRMLSAESKLTAAYLWQLGAGDQSQIEIDQWQIAKRFGYLHIRSPRSHLKNLRTVGLIAMPETKLPIKQITLFDPDRILIERAQAMWLAVQQQKKGIA